MSYRWQCDRSFFWYHCRAARDSVELLAMLLRSLSMRGSGSHKYENIPSGQPEEAQAASSFRRGRNIKEDIKSALFDKLPTIERRFLTNIFLLVPLIFSVSLLLGTIFYRVHHGWELSTSFYYSSQVLAGEIWQINLTNWSDKLILKLIIVEPILNETLLC